MGTHKSLVQPLCLLTSIYEFFESGLDWAESQRGRQGGEEEKREESLPGSREVHLLLSQGKAKRAKTQQVYPL